MGCSGFIISDESGYFVSRKTRAYLQYGELAFNHVPEEIIQKYFGIVPITTEEKKEAAEAEDILSRSWVLPSVGI